MIVTITINTDNKAFKGRESDEVCLLLTRLERCLSLCPVLLQDENVIRLQDSTQEHCGRIRIERER